MAFKFEGKEMYPIFVSAVLLVNSLQSGKAWQACAQQTEKRQSHTNSADSRRAVGPEPEIWVPVPHIQLA